jgi:hypothetical protein
MNYTFDIIGVSPILDFFNHQHQSQEKFPPLGVEYMGAHKCTLDAFIESVEPLPQKWGWDLDEVVGTVIDFWMKNSESIHYWKLRLNDAGRDNLLVVRLADLKALKVEFDTLLVDNW